eukprot:scaffold1471_cov413-Prasinococcus_capsulatus_cf.AAC.7
MLPGWGQGETSAKDGYCPGIFYFIACHGTCWVLRGKVELQLTVRNGCHMYRLCFPTQGGACPYVTTPTRQAASHKSQARP